MDGARPEIDKTVETVIDRFYGLVSSSKSITAKRAAAALSLAPGQVEKLARLLEDAKLVSIDYGVSDMVISLPVAPEKAREQKRLAFVAAQQYECRAAAAELLGEVSAVRGAAGYASDLAASALSRANALSLKIRNTAKLRQEEAAAYAKDLSLSRDNAAAAKELAKGALASCEEIEQRVAEAAPQAQAGKAVGPRK